MTVTRDRPAAGGATQACLTRILLRDSESVELVRADGRRSRAGLVAAAQAGTSESVTVTVVT
jgi:hypothetical protein